MEDNRSLAELIKDCEVLSEELKKMVNDFVKKLKGVKEESNE